jgi:hypothetical protein
MPEPVKALTDVKRALNTCQIAWAEIWDAEAGDVIATLAACSLQRDADPVCSPSREFPGSYLTLVGAVSSASAICLAEMSKNMAQAEAWLLES